MIAMDTDKSMIKSVVQKIKEVMYKISVPAMNENVTRCIPEKVLISVPQFSEKRQNRDGLRHLRKTQTV